MHSWGTRALWGWVRYGLKLMNVLTMDNPALVEQLYRSGLMPLMFSFFELENRNNNVHNVKLVLKVFPTHPPPRCAVQYSMIYSFKQFPCPAMHAPQDCNQRFFVW